MEYLFIYLNFWFKPKPMKPLFQKTDMYESDF